MYTDVVWAYCGPIVDSLWVVYARVGPLWGEYARVGPLWGVYGLII